MEMTFWLPQAEAALAEAEASHSQDIDRALWWGFLWPG